MNTNLLGFAEIGLGHFLSHQHVMPYRSDLFFAVAVQNFSERAATFFVEVNRHFRLGIDAEWITDPATIEVRQESLGGPREVDAFTIENIRRRSCGDGVTRHAGKAAVFTNQLLAQLGHVRIDLWRSRSI